MQKLEVFGANKLKGQIKISGSKKRLSSNFSSNFIIKKKSLPKKFTQSKRY
jgi:UDP-N-acetylglucosamine enolpyruvyl transferase